MGLRSFGGGSNSMRRLPTKMEKHSQTQHMSKNSCLDCTINFKNSRYVKLELKLATHVNTQSSQ